jgi:ABC-2 type transport system ATP-binding protein
LILDEPTAGLDPFYRNVLLKQLEVARTRGKTILISSHILSDLQEIVDLVIAIDKGKIVYSGEKVDVAELFNKLISSKKIAKKKEQI